MPKDSGCQHYNMDRRKIEKQWPPSVYTRKLARRKSTNFLATAILLKGLIVWHLFPPSLLSFFFSLSISPLSLSLLSFSQVRSVRPNPSIFQVKPSGVISISQIGQLKLCRGLSVCLEGGGGWGGYRDGQSVTERWARFVPSLLDISEILKKYSSRIKLLLLMSLKS